MSAHTVNSRHSAKQTLGNGCLSRKAKLCIVIFIGCAVVLAAVLNASRRYRSGGDEREDLPLIVEKSLHTNVLLDDGNCGQWTSNGQTRRASSGRVLDEDSGSAWNEAPSSVQRLVQQRNRPRVYDGEDTQEFQFPWHITVIVQVTKSSLSLCGGSLITPEWVLTAAHCVYQSSSDGSCRSPRLHAIILFGGTAGQKSVKELDGSKVQRVFASNVYVPENYNCSKLSSTADIALIKASAPFVINRRVSTICVPPNSCHADQLFRNARQCVITGYGDTSSNNTVSARLLHATIDLASRHCQPRHSPICACSADQICIGNGGNRTGSICKGDSGGPIACYSVTHNSWYQAGVASGAKYRASRYVCGTTDVEIFTNVGYYRTWIRK